MSGLELKVPPLLQVLVVALLMWVVAWLLPQAAVHAVWLPVVAALLAVAGVVVALLGVLAFRRAQTTVDPRTPDKTARLVSAGVYRFSRNPMYLGFLLLLLGWVTFLANGAAAVWLPLFVLYMNRYQITPEERFMRTKFGGEYLAYQRTVRRWL